MRTYFPFLCQFIEEKLRRVRIILVSASIIWNPASASIIWNRTFKITSLYLSENFMQYILLIERHSFNAWIYKHLCVYKTGWTYDSTISIKKKTIKKSPFFETTVLTEKLSKKFNELIKNNTKTSRGPAQRLIKRKKKQTKTNETTPPQKIKKTN